MAHGKSIRIYLPESSVTGIRYAEIVNRTGQAIACPRTRVGGLDDWPETRKPGVYFLFEARLGDAKPAVYIGESENVSDRVLTHDRNKDFWSEVVIFTSKDENLTKSHVKYLESNLERLARFADRYELENGNTPTQSSLPRSERDAMDEMTDDIRLVLGTLGYPVLEPLVQRSGAVRDGGASADTGLSRNSSIVDLVFKVHSLVAYGVPTDEGFVLKKGSMVAKVDSDSAARKIVKLKEQLVNDQRLVDKGDHYVLTEDLLMSSPSYAAVLVAGTARSGPQSWFDAAGKSLKAIEDEAAGRACSVS